MPKSIIKGVMVFLLGVAIGMISHQMFYTAPTLNHEGQRLQIVTNAQLISFSLSEQDRAVVAFLSPKMENLTERISQLEDIVSVNPELHLLFVWDGEIPGNLSLEYQANSYVHAVMDRKVFPSFCVVDTAFTILYRTDSFSALQRYLANS